MKGVCNSLYYMLFLMIVVLLYLLFTERARKETFLDLDNATFLSQLKKEIVPRITCKADDESIHVSWTSTLFDVEQYLIKVEELNSKNPNLLLKVMPDPNCEQCSRTITGLKNGTPYVVTLLIQTKKGNSKSNPVSVIPNGPVKSHEISDILLKTPKEIKESVESLDVPCGYYREKNTQFHKLDEDYQPIRELI